MLSIAESFDDEIGNFKATTPARRLESPALEFTNDNERAGDPVLENHIAMDLPQQVCSDLFLL